MTDGKKHHNFRDFTGQTFGALTVVRPHHTDGKKWRWEFRCQCGNTVITTGTSAEREVKRGGTPNCGCMTRALIAAGNTGHGMSSHPAYAVYRSMIDRCRLPTHQAWKNYGARGIVVCPSWRASFENFWADMGLSYQPGLTLDRKDNEGDYSPENCRWVSMRTQTVNKRNSVRVFDVVTTAKRTGVSKSTLYYWVRKGLTRQEIAQKVAERLSGTS